MSRISFFNYLQYAWGNRRAIASHEGCADYTQRCAQSPEAAQLLQKARRAPSIEDSWRYDSTRRPLHDKLLAAYQLNEISGEGTAFERALRLMDWLTAHSCYNGMEIRASFLFQGKRETADRLLRYTYDGGFARAINCRHKAFALADCLMTVGINALPVTIVQTGGCHLVVHAWLPEEERWVMLDPSLNSYITDETGRALHLIEIYDRHRRGEQLHVAQYHLNGKQDCRDVYLNSFVLGCLLEIEVYNGTGSKRKGPRNRLVPEGVEPKDAKLRTITTMELLAPPNSI